MKNFSLVKDTIIIIGCIVGVGFVGGKEVVSFVGSTINALFFGVTFAITLGIIMTFCAKERITTLRQFTAKIFGKGSAFWEGAICLCLFVSVVTIIAVAQELLSQILQISTPLPLFSLMIVFATFYLAKKPLTLLKWVNLAGLFLAILALTFTKNNIYCGDKLQIPLYKTCVYLFASVTLGLSLTTTVSQQKSPLQCFVASGLSAIVIVLLMLFVLSKCDDGGVCVDNQSRWVKVVFCTAILVCSLSCAIATILPLCNLLEDFLPSKNWQLSIVLTLAVAFSLLGFDCILQYGYLFVAVVGLIFVIKVITLWINGSKD